MLGLVALAALLRLPGLGTRSLWVDEGFEYDAVRGSFGHLVDRLVNRETTPPLSFAYEWLCTKVLGTSEFALRLPFALLGIAAVVVMYVAARELGGRRAGLIAALLTACNPMLVWHAQDARSYSLLVLLIAGTIVALARRRIGWWSALALAAVATHHFAIFVIAPEAAWLLWERGWRPVLPYFLAPAWAMVPLAALARSQAGAGAWIAKLDLGNRLVHIPRSFVTGYQVAPALAYVLAALLLAALVPALARSRGTPGGRAMLALGLAALALPLLAAAVGKDFLIDRNVIGSLVALTIAAAIGLDRIRFGVPLLVAVCAVWVAITVATAGDPKYRAEDWRGAVRAARPAQAMLLMPEYGFPVANYYWRTARRAADGTVSSLAVVRMGQADDSGCTIPPSPPVPSGGAVQVARGQCWEVDVHRWDAPRLVSAGVAALAG